MTTRLHAMGLHEDGAVHSHKLSKSLSMPFYVVLFPIISYVVRNIDMMECDQVNHNTYTLNDYSIGSRYSTRKSVYLLLQQREIFHNDIRTYRHCNALRVVNKHIYTLKLMEGHCIYFWCIWHYLIEIGIF